MCTCSLALGVREVVLCKDQKGKCGLSMFAASKGVFVSFVAKASPAAIGGLRFGDQVLAVSVVALLKHPKLMCIVILSDQWRNSSWLHQ